MTQGDPIPPPPSDPFGSPTGAPPPPTGAPNVPATGYPMAGASGYPNAYVGPTPTQDDKTMGMLAHLLGIFLGFIGPLIIWLIKKDQSPFVDDQGKESLNFQIMLMIGYVIGSVTSCLFIGFLILPAVWIFGIIFSIIAALKSKDGIAYRYPVNLRLIK
jgi:uncharacterized Tic20 family protein